MMNNPDFLIIGAGIIGLSIARELQNRFPGLTITVVDKENGPGQHASGRNSGVLHSGIYYPADSLKARFTHNGNLAWQNYCSEHGLQIDKCGKLIVPKNQKELQILDVLEARGLSNGIDIQRVDSIQARKIEPRVRVFEQALFIPSTSTINPVQLIKNMEREFLAKGGKIKYMCPFISRNEGNTVNTAIGLISAGFIINCAGLYADRVAQAFGFGKKYTLLPFKGIYLYASTDVQSPATHIYPVPDLRNPFLGVHFTRTIDGHTKIGPTAMLTFWREHYQGFEKFKFDEFFQISGFALDLLFCNRNNFRKLAWQEFKKQWKKHLIRDAESLFTDARQMGFKKWGQPGIRAQLLDMTTGNLEMDFIIEGDEKSIHVLNAVSPALTCALPFARFVVDRIAGIKTSDER